MRKKDIKGFTLAELLIVVAIIGVLVAISIPIFSKQLEKSRDAVTVANIRSAYTEAMTEYISPDPIDKNKKGNAYPSGWIGSGYHLWLNYKSGKINVIDVVIRIENTKTTAELNKMLQDSNLPFKVKASASSLPSGMYLLTFSFTDDGFSGTATLKDIPNYWKNLELSA
ncbi:prepilin-type N-terminal cleavage/methylation domain-containing protein [Stecheria sp. CLA-KB-P133]|uniref:Prepilin-type N-terminal cleavage/methylation domain-containing protein n=1 Tax=Grylomicrobium aquisgranensis TaxID=2926318 RepID=A0AB35U403_9FIRM|nr:prepilin-type N-terminal cleavage/methylation domain-containing protein [Stecheria sp. CLA-KB-P133]